MALVHTHARARTHTHTHTHTEVTTLVRTEKDIKIRARVFWDMMLCQRASDSKCFEGISAFIYKGLGSQNNAEHVAHRSTY
jgi:hypothetical protein